MCMANIGSSVVCHITSALDFDEEDCVIQIEWTKILNIANPYSKF